jgi:hypothetical protein
MSAQDYELLASLLTRANRVWQGYYGSHPSQRVSGVEGVSRSVGEGQLAVSDVLSWLKSEMEYEFASRNGRFKRDRWVERTEVLGLRCGACASVLSVGGECPLCDLGLDGKDRP